MMKSVKLNKNDMNLFIEKTNRLEHQKPHQYEKVRINDEGIILILYNSGSLVYEDNAQTVDFLESNLENILKNNKKSDTEKDGKDKSGKLTSNQGHIQHGNSSKKIQHENNDSGHDYPNTLLSKYEYTIGSDETGKGEWFGPLVVCAVATSRSENNKLKRIGIDDSKKLSKNQIEKLYKKIMEINIKHKVIVLRPFSYNRLYAKFRKEGKNLNHLLAYLHSLAIRGALKQIDSTDTLIVIDKFDKKKMDEYLNTNSNVIQIENGERFIPVATSSIIAKYHYEKVLNELEERYNIRLTKKSNIKNIDKKILDKVAKTHFKNVAKHM